MGCGMDTVLLSDDAVQQAVVEFGAAVYGNGRSANGMDGGDEFDGGPLHQLNFRAFSQVL